MDAATFRKLVRVHAVGTVFENAAGEVLLLKRRPDTHEGGTYGLVGGTVEAGETPLEAAVREVREEIGVTLETEALELVRRHENLFPAGVVEFDVFRSKTPLKGENKLDPNEHTGYLWGLQKDLLPRLDLHAGLADILRHIFKDI